MKKNNKVLIVDDNQSNLQVISHGFAGTDYKIALASNSESAIEILNQDIFDLIILDIMMPDMDGFELCSFIRNKLKLEVPIIFLTAKTDKIDVLYGFEIGGQDYITKPFDKRELLVRANTQVELYQSKQKLQGINRILEEKVAERTIDLAKSNSELIKANEKLQLLDDAKLEFLRIIAHEVRTPLNGIKGFAELIDQINETEKISDYIKMLLDSIERLDEFALLALDITGLKLNKYNIKNDLFDINDCFQKAINSWIFLLKDKNIGIKQKNLEKSILISGEAKLINRAIDILIENAIKHTPGNTEIELFYETSVDQYLFSIHDKGKGFHENLLKNKFTLFNTGEQHCNHNMGLNLPLANLIILAHNGKLTIDNHPEGGGFVQILLPLWTQ